MTVFTKAVPRVADRLFVDCQHSSDVASLSMDLWVHQLVFDVYYRFVWYTKPSAGLLATLLINILE